MRGKKRTALVMGSQKEKSSLSTLRLKTLRDNKVGVMIQDGLEPIAMTEMHREVWAVIRLTDRSIFHYSKFTSSLKS